MAITVAQVKNNSPKDSEEQLCCPRKVLIFQCNIYGVFCVNIRANKSANSFDVERKVNFNGLKIFSPYLCVSNAFLSPNMCYINWSNIKLLYQLDFRRSAFGHFSAALC